MPPLQGGFTKSKSERGSINEVFYFNGNRFTYRFAGCFSSRTGEGIFTLTGDRLVLSFHRVAADTLRRVRPLAVVSTSPPTFCVRVMYRQLLLLPDVIVWSRQNHRVSASTGPTSTAYLLASLSYSALPQSGTRLSVPARRRPMLARWV
ncbi:MAG: hypothetical protein EOO62_28760 [Hymenobacter sp.]|nr:MAG: hypothetical protein EOO62_28760 [Hymenobacter sp.]